MAKITGKQLVTEYRKTIGQYTYAQRDCIGSIWKILERYGAKTNLVGSNWFARHELRNMRPLTDKSQLYDGCAVLKTVLPGQSGYALPDRYLSDADLIDYNHIGIGTDGGEILDSTRTASGRDGPGVSTAKIGPNSWDIIADFEDVEYSDVPSEPPQEGADTVTGYINLPPTSNVFHRISPSNGSQWYGRINGGEAVEIVSDSGEWTRVRHGGNDGYVMSKFITTDPAAQPDPMPPDAPFQDSANKEELVQDLTVYTSPDGTVETEPLVVTVTGGGTARMRKKPDTNALILSNIRDGVYVQGVRRGEDGWYQIKYNGKIGWMMEQYLRVDGEAYPGDSDPPDVVDVDRAALIAEGRGLLKRLGAILDNL